MIAVAFATQPTRDVVGRIVEFAVNSHIIRFIALV